MQNKLVNIITQGMKPFEDPSTLIEQSASSKYSNSTFIIGITFGYTPGLICI